jgi:hypothetical protein
MLKTIIVTNKVKQIMYSTQTPPFAKGAETAATVSLPKHYIKPSANLQDNQQNKKNATQGQLWHLMCESLHFNRFIYK